MQKKSSQIRRGDKEYLVGKHDGRHACHPWNDAKQSFQSGSWDKCMKAKNLYSGHEMMTDMKDNGKG